MPPGGDLQHHAISLTRCQASVQRLSRLLNDLQRSSYSSVSSPDQQEASVHPSMGWHREPAEVRGTRQGAGLHSSHTPPGWPQT